MLPFLTGVNNSLNSGYVEIEEVCSGTYLQIVEVLVKASYLLKIIKTKNFYLRHFNLAIKLEFEEVGEPYFLMEGFDYSFAIASYSGVGSSTNSSKNKKHKENKD